MTDLKWEKEDSKAVAKYRKEFEKGKIEYTVLEGSLKELISKK